MAEHKLESTSRGIRREISTLKMPSTRTTTTSARAARSDDAKTESAVPVLYIAGIGRSGSTLLGRALGSVDGLLFLGEIMHLFGRGMQHNERCACGAAVRGCEIWSGVLEDLDAEGLCPDPEAVERFRHRFTEGHALLTPFLPWTPAAVRSGLESFRELLSATYRSLHRRTGWRAIVDSSKSPAYARILMDTPGIEVHLVHLVRDARGVAFSLAKARKRPGTSRSSEFLDQRSAPAASALWSGAHLLTESLRSRAVGYVRVRYADFVASPASEVGRVLRSLRFPRFGEDGNGAAPLAHLEGKTLQLGVQHVLAGHPVRSATGQVELSEDVEWRRALARPKRLLVSALTLPLLARYGCLRNGSHPQRDE